MRKTRKIYSGSKSHRSHFRRYQPGRHQGSRMFRDENRLKAELDIPVMHDDQHGTAIISSAGLLNALEIAGKKIENVRIVVNGAVKPPPLPVQNCM